MNKNLKIPCFLICAFLLLCSIIEAAQLPPSESEGQENGVREESLGPTMEDILETPDEDDSREGQQ